MIARRRHAKSPLSLPPQLPERSSPSRVRFAAQKSARPGPLRAVPKFFLRQGKGGQCKVETTRRLPPHPASRWSAPTQNT